MYMHASILGEVRINEGLYDFLVSERQSKLLPRLSLGRKLGQPVLAIGIFSE